jgi:tetratricopeptide (TPR) repeat protein
VETPIFIPVEAQDFARRKRRRILACGAALAAIALAAGLIYKRSTDPLHAQESFDSGRRLLQNNRYEQAILSFDRAIDLKSDFAEAYFLRGTARVALGVTDRAIADFAKVIELRPGDSRPLLERCAAHLNQADLPAAIADCTKALDIDSRLERAYNLRGAALRKKGDLQQALADFNRAVEFGPTPDNYYQRAATYELLGDFHQAIADLDRMIVLEPGAPAYLARSAVRLAMGDAEGAKRDRRFAAGFYPPPDFWFNDMNRRVPRGSTE